MPTVSVIIPVWNGAADLAQCLARLSESSVPPGECIVVDDGSTDNSAAVAGERGARVVSTGERRGPAHARNLGAREATGDLLCFLDADVCVEAGTLERILARFADDPKLDALIGSYDDAPPAGNFLSQYKNLQHHYVHQTANPNAATFWTGCGAIRRAVFLESGGFDESFPRPSIEDIELGGRLRRAGKRIMLDRRLLVQHRKRWGFASLLKTDFFDRALPWTELILRSGRMPNDLNLRSGQRLSVALVCGAVPLLLAAGAVSQSGLPLFGAALAVAVVLTINARFYRYLGAKRGTFFALRAALMHLFYYLYSGVAFAVGAARYLAHGHAARQ